MEAVSSVYPLSPAKSKQGSEKLKQALDGSFDTVRELAEQLVEGALSNRIDPFLSDPQNLASTTAVNLVGALTDRRLELNIPLKMILARAARVFLDITLWRSVHDKHPFTESTVDEMRKSLEAAVKSATRAPIALQHELECCLEAIKALPSNKDLLWEDGGTTALQLILSAASGEGLSEIPSALKKVQELRALMSKGGTADILYLFWVSPLSRAVPANFDKLEQKIGNSAQPNVLVAAVGILADLVRNGIPDIQQRAFSLLLKIASLQLSHEPLWKVRRYAAQHVRALPSHLFQREINAFIKERIDLKKEPKPTVREALQARPLQWNNKLRMLESTPTDEADRERQLREADLLTHALRARKLEDPLLLEYVKANPDLKTLDLTPYQGISPQGVCEALQECPRLEVLILKGHEHINIQHLISSVPQTLTTLDLTRNPLSNSDLAQLAQRLPHLVSLTLDGCPNVTGATLDQLAVHSLSLQGVRIHSGLFAPLQKSTLKHLDLTDCPHLDLSPLQHGGHLETLRLGKCNLSRTTAAACTTLRTLALTNVTLPNNFAFPPGLIKLSLEFVTGVHSQVSSLPESLEALTLKNCPNVGDKESIAILARCSNLECLDLSGTVTTGFGFLTTDPAPQLAELTLEYDEAACDKARSRENVTLQPWPTLASKAPNLKRLTLFKTATLDRKELIKTLECLPKLTELTAPHQTTADSDLFRALIDLPELENIDLGTAFRVTTELDLSGSNLTDEHVDLLLSQCIKLHTLNLSNCKSLTSQGLKALLQAHPNLTSLDVSGCDEVVVGGILDLSDLPDLSGPLLEQLLRAFPKLDKLILSGCMGLTDQQIAITIRACRGASELDLSGGLQVGTRTFKALEECGAVKRLSLTHSSLNPADIGHLAGMPNLQIVNLSNCSGLTNTTQLNLAGSITLRDSLLQSFLFDTPSLQVLVLKDCNQLTSIGVRDALTLCPELTSLDLSGCKQIGTEDLRSLMDAAPKLQSVHHWQGCTTRGNIPQETWPGEECGAALYLPTALKGIYQSYWERHFGQDKRHAELRAALRCYIPPLVEGEGNPGKPLETTAIGEFLAVEDPRVLFLLMGGSGAGKSLSLERLVDRAWTGFSADNVGRVPPFIPLHIDLKSVAASEKDLAAQALEKMGYTSPQIELLRQQYSFAFYLDGYDENPLLKNTPLCELLPNWKGKVTISCRKEYLASDGNYWDRVAPDQTRCEYALLPFDEDQINNYLRTYLTPDSTTWTQDQYLSAFETTPGLKELITSPLMLRLIVEVLPELPKSKLRVKRSDIYDAFVQGWFNRAIRKMEQRGLDRVWTLDEVYEFANRLGFQMTQGSVYVAYDKTTAWKAFFSEEIQTRKELCPLQHIGNDGYQFFHTSLAEYFSAEHLYRALLLHENQSDEYVRNVHTQQLINQLESHPLNQERNPRGKKVVGRDALLVTTPAVLDFLIDKTEGIAWKQERLLDIVLASKKRPSVAVAAANACTLLSWEGFSFSGKDLSNIQIPYANLDQGIFHHVSFVEACLQGVQFGHSQVVRCDFTGAALTDALFGVGPEINTQQIMLRMECSPKKYELALALRPKSFDSWLASEWDSSVSVEIWEINNCTKLRTFKNKGLLRYHPRGDLVLLVEKPHKTVPAIFSLWSTVTGGCSGIYRLPKAYAALSAESIGADWSPNGTHFVTTTGHIWSLETQRAVCLLESMPETTPIIKYDLHNKTILSITKDCEITQWSTESPLPLTTRKLATIAQEPLSISPDAKYVVTSDPHGSGVLVSSIENGRVVLTTPQVNHLSGLKCAWSNDGQLLGLVGYSNPGLAAAFVYSVYNQKLISILTGIENGGESIGFSTDNRTLLLAGDFGTIYQRSIETHTRHHAPHTQVTSIASTTDGTHIAAGYTYGSLRIWSTDTKEEVLHQFAQSRAPEQSGRVNALTFSPDGHYLAVSHRFDVPSSSSEPTLESVENTYIFSTKTGHAISKIKGFCTGTLIWSTDSQSLLSGTETWNLDTKERSRISLANPDAEYLRREKEGGLVVPFGNRKVAYREGCELGQLFGLAAGVHGLLGGNALTRNLWFRYGNPFAVVDQLRYKVAIWSIEENRRLSECYGHFGGLSSMAWHPDGEILASGGADCAIRFWLTTTGKESAKLTTPATVRTLVFRPDGNELAAGCDDHTIYLWNIRNRTCIGALQGHNRAVTQALWPIPNQIVTGSEDGSVAIWQPKVTPFGEKWCLIWQSVAVGPIVIASSFSSGALPQISEQSSAASRCSIQ